MDEIRLLFTLRVALPRGPARALKYLWIYLDSVDASSAPRRRRLGLVSSRTDTLPLGSTEQVLIVPMVNFEVGLSQISTVFSIV